MAKDSLARGAKSATFMAGTPEKDAPIEFHGTVAPEGTHTIVGDCPHGVSGTVCILCDADKFGPSKSEPKSLEELAALYEPMNDRVLLRRVTEQNKSLVQRPDAFVQSSDVGLVIAAGPDAHFSVRMGDKVRFGHYNAEDIEIEGETLVLVSAHDIRLKIKA